MRADVRELETNCHEDEQHHVAAEQPCGSGSSDSANSNGGSVKRKKQLMVADAANSPRSSSSNNSLKTANSASSKSGSQVMPNQNDVKKKNTKKHVSAASSANKSKRKSIGENPIVRPPELEEDTESDEDNPIPGPSTATDIAFGYDPAQVVPWATKSYYPLSMDGLHEEIVDCWQWLRPSQLETAIRYRVYEKVRNIILHYWHPIPIRISVFGSLRTRLYLPSSDIDMLVECDTWIGLGDEDIAEVMHHTMTCLQPHLDKVSFHPGAFVPILKFVDPDTHLNIDISFNTVQGVKAATYMTNVKEEFPVLEPLLMLLKQFVFQNKLHEAYSGGLSSYGISLMLVNFFQIHYPSYRKRKPESDNVNLGLLLMRFFEVYGHELNYNDVAIDPSRTAYRRRFDLASQAPATGAITAAAAPRSQFDAVVASGGAAAAAGASSTDDAVTAAGGAAIVESSELQQLQRPLEGGRNAKTPVLLSVHDPLHQGNEVCRASFNIYTVRTLFQSALVQLRGVFVADRPGSQVWRQNVYNGSMLGRLLNFSPGQINFRYWLKGFVLSHSSPSISSLEQRRRPTSAAVATSTGIPKVIYGSLLCAASDISCLLRVPKAGQRALEIKRPDEPAAAPILDPRLLLQQRVQQTSRAGEQEPRHGEFVQPLQAYQQPFYVRAMVVEQQQQPEPQPQPQHYSQCNPRASRGGSYGGGGHRGGYQREFRGNRSHYQHHNGGGGGGGGGLVVHQLQHHHQQFTLPGGGFHSRTWERVAGGNPRRFFDARNRSRSSETLVEQATSARPQREPSPLEVQHLLQQQEKVAAATTSAVAVSTTPSVMEAAASVTYKRSDSAVSSLTTTVMGTAGSFATATSSVSSPAINALVGPSTPAAAVVCSSSSSLRPSSSTLLNSGGSSGSSTSLSRSRGDRASCRGEVYVPPAARKAAEAAAAAGGTRGCSPSSSNGGSSKKKNSKPVATE